MAVASLVRAVPFQLPPGGSSFDVTHPELLSAGVVPIACYAVLSGAQVVDSEASSYRYSQNYYRPYPSVLEFGVAQYGVDNSSTSSTGFRRQSAFFLGLTALNTGTLISANGTPIEGGVTCTATNFAADRVFYGYMVLIYDRDGSAHATQQNSASGIDAAITITPALGRAPNLILASNVATTSTGTTNAAHSFGAWHNNQQRCISYFQQHNQASCVVKTRVRDDCILTRANATTRFDIQNVNATNYQLFTRVEGGIQVNCTLFALSLPNTKIDLRTFVAPASGATVTQSLGFSPSVQLLHIVGNSTINSEEDTTSKAESFSCGVQSRDTARAVMGYGQAGSANTVTKSRYSVDEHVHLLNGAARLRGTTSLRMSSTVTSFSSLLPADAVGFSLTFGKDTEAIEEDVALSLTGGLFDTFGSRVRVVTGILPDTPVSSVDLTHPDFVGNIPKAALVFCSSTTQLETDEATARHSIGMIAGTAQGSAGANNRDNVTPCSGLRWVNTADVIDNWNATQTIKTKVRGTLITNGIQLSDPTSGSRFDPNNAWHVTAILFGGNQLQAWQTESLLPSGLDASVTFTPGFRPDVIFLTSMAANTNETTTTVRKFGIWDRSSGNQFSWSNITDHNTAAQRVWGGFEDGAIGANFSSSIFNARHVIEEVADTTFKVFVRGTQNSLLSTSSIMAIKFGSQFARTNLQEILSKTTASVSNVNIGFKPSVGLVFFSDVDIKNSLITNGPGGESMSIGTFDATDSNRVHWSYEQSNANPAFTRSRTGATRAIKTNLLQATAQVKTNGYSLTWDTVDATERHGFVWAVQGDPDATPAFDIVAAVEWDSAQTLTRLEPLVISPAIEADVGLTLWPAKAKTLTVGAESDRCYPLLFGANTVEALVRVVPFRLPATAGATLDVTHPDMVVQGVTPTSVLVFTSGAVTLETLEAPARMSVGLGARFGTSVARGTLARNAEASTTQTGFRRETPRVGVITSSTTHTSANVNFTASYITGGVRFAQSTAVFGSAKQYYGFAVLIYDAENRNAEQCDAFTITTADTAGNKVARVLTYQPTLIIGQNSRGTATSGTGAVNSWGVYHAGSQHSVCNDRPSGQIGQTDYSVVQTNRIGYAGGAAGASYEVTDVGPTGFSIATRNDDTAVALTTLYMRALNLRIHVSQRSGRTTLGQDVVTGLGFKPGVVLLAWTTNTLSDTVQGATDTLAESLSYGYGDATSKRAITSYGEEKALPTLTRSRATDDASIWLQRGGVPIAATATIQTNGYTIDWTAVDGQLTQGLAIAIAGPGLTQVVKVLDAAVEADVALTLWPSKVSTLNVAAESDVALALTLSTAQPIGVAVEDDFALTLWPAKRVSLANAIEIDLAIDKRPAGLIAQAVEADVALTLWPSKVGTLQTGTEGDSALGLLVGKALTLGLSVEEDNAVLLRTTGRIFPASEEDFAYPVRQVIGVEPAVERDLAFAIKYVVFGVAVEQDLAFTMTARSQITNVATRGATLLKEATKSSLLLNNPIKGTSL